MTKRLYLNSRARSVNAQVLNIDNDGNRTLVILDRTVAHPKGGGQKSDRGTINGIPFSDVLSQDGRQGPVLHYLVDNPNFSVGDTVKIEVDPEWRHLQERSHNAGHLIADLVNDLFPQLKGVAGHHYPGEARVEFVGEPLPDFEDLKSRLESALTGAIQSDLPIEVVGDPLEDRAIKIGNFNPTPCGGTHPQSTGELGCVEIKSVKAKRGRLRISYVVM